MHVGLTLLLGLDNDMLLNRILRGIKIYRPSTANPTFRSIANRAARTWPPNPDDHWISFPFSGKLRPPLESDGIVAHAALAPAAQCESQISGDPVQRCVVDCVPKDQPAAQLGPEVGPPPDESPPGWILRWC